MTASRVERRIRRAAWLIVAGLAVQSLSFIWLHPLAFSAFLGIGIPLVAAGVIFYLLALLQSAPKGEHTAGAGAEPAGSSNAGSTG